MIHPHARTAALIIAALLIPALHGCGTEPVPAEPELRPVRTEATVAITGGQARTFSGTVRAGVDSLISFRVAGTIEELPVQVEAKARSVEGVTSVRIELVWDPPWDPSMMSEAARLELGMI